MKAALGWHMYLLQRIIQEFNLVLFEIKKHIISFSCWTLPLDLQSGELWLLPFLHLLLPFQLQKIMFLVIGKLGNASKARKFLRRKSVVGCQGTSGLQYQTFFLQHSTCRERPYKTKYLQLHFSYFLANTFLYCTEKNPRKARNQPSSSYACF